MNLRASLLAVLLFVKSRQSLTLVEEHPKIEDAPEFKERYLDLPDFVIKVKETKEGFYSEPSKYALPYDTVEVFKALMGSPTWFAPMVKQLSEEEWVIAICSMNPVVAFEQAVRKKELKFKILRKK